MRSIAIGLGVWLVGVASQPTRIASKTFDADHAIESYEWFHDAYGNYQARLAQVRQFETMLAGEVDRSEKAWLRIETAAVQQACRDLAQRYNANAESRIAISSWAVTCPRRSMRTLANKRRA